MKYVDVADALYGANIASILNVILNAQEAEYFDQKINSMVIHTGFVFSTLEQEKFVLLYDLTTKKVIRQTYLQEPLPQLNGLLLAKVNANHFNLPTPIFCQQIFSNNDIYKYYKIDAEEQLVDKGDIRLCIDNKKVTINTIEVLKDQTLIRLKQYPLRRTLREKLALVI